MCFLCLFIGFLGNIIVLISYAHYSKAWTSSTIFLFNLALCDFAWIVIVPISIYFSINKLVMYSVPAFCQFKRIVFNINTYGSIFFLMLISFDRYLYSVHPLTAPRWWNKKKAKLCTTAIWLFIFLESIPDIYYILNRKNAVKVITCLDYLEEPLDFVVPLTLSRFVFGFLIPGAIIFTCYFCSLRALRHLKDLCQSSRAKKPFKLVSATMLVFVISFVPYHIVMMVIIFYRLNCSIDYGNISLLFAFYQISEMLCSVSSCANPVIFILANNKLKHVKLLTFSHIRLFCCHSNKVGIIT
ncbi:P2Y purinoceptor 1-like [Leptodactylus fuscus]